MLQEARFENYRCLRDVTISLEPFTVLVGANATGKSTVLRGLVEQGISPEDCWMHKGGLSIEIQFTQQQRATKRFDPRTGGRRSGQLHSAQLLHLDLSQLRAHNQVSEQRSLAANGGNLANVFATLSRKTQEELAGKFCALVPVFSDVNLRPRGQGNHAFVFEDRWSKTTLKPTEVSDGTMLVLAYLVAQHQEADVDLLAIEEPERGLHPYLLGELVRMFRDMATGQMGRVVQVVVATHSAELLDHVQPSEVRFLSRDANRGEVSVERPREDTDSLQAAFREYEGSLGSLWLSGGLGGVPDA